MYNYFIKHYLLSPTTLLLRRLGGVLLMSFIVMICYLSISSFHNNDHQHIENLQRTIALVSTGETQAASPQGKNLNHVLYVISLDGKITAIDVQQKGRQIWTTHTGTSLIDSSLSQLEIVRNSRSIRLIPSLIGGLYEQYDDTEQIEPLPFDAESLLNTTFHLHDEWIMTGGKDIDTLALDLHTGQLVYSFSKHHLDQSASENSTCSAPMLIIKRIKQTVRARSARNGHEKWNFSVSNHELLHLYTPLSPEVLEQSDNHHEHLVFFEYQLQTGLILAFDSTNQLIWTSSINSPIAAVWEWRNGQLKEKSLFKTKLSCRLAFMGEFNSTPYVLISSGIQRQLIAQARKNNVASSTDIQRPILTSWHKANRKRHLLIDSKLSENADELSGIDHKYPLAVRQNSLWDTHGYLELINPIENIIDGDKNELAVHVHRHTTWTSLMITSSLGLVTLIVLLLWFSQRKEEHQERIESANGDVMLEYQRPQSSSFQSRYLIEYEHVRFLGRGGFGIVFEAINKLDERRVAIKRVSLKRPSGKERALKEIRCMAILNHPNLIQYYYAWNECPPHGWQDDEDRKFINTNFEVTKDSLSVFSSSIDNASGELAPLIDFTFERSLNPPPVLDDSQSSLFEHSSNKELSENVDKDISDGPRTYFYFVMELCQSASLRDRLIKQTLHHSQAWSIFDQIIKGIEYIHSQKFIHQDLKPSNILFSRDDMIKIGDFGLVSAFGEDRIERNEDHELGGTLLYMSPEQINRQSYNQKVDIYALGIILFELLYPFATQMERAHALANIRLPTPSFPEDFQYNQYICRLIRWLLSYSSHDRPKACEFRQDSSYQHILRDEHLFSQL